MFSPLAEAVRSGGEQMTPQIGPGRPIGWMRFSVCLILLLVACNATPDVSDEEQRRLSNRTLEYERCVNARVAGFSGTTQAVEAYARAVQQSCRLQRERVKDALGVYDSSYQEEYMDSIDLLTRETVRRSLYRLR